MQFKALRDLPPWQKLPRLASLNRLVRDPAWSGLREIYPDAGEAELTRRYAELALGAGIVTALCLR